MSAPPRILHSWPPLHDFVRRVDQAGAEVPFAVTSWYRDPRRNALAGGDAYSQHLLAIAADLVPIAPFTTAQLASALRRQGLPQVLDFGGYVHAALWPAGTLRALLAR